MIDFVATWSAETELPARRLLGWLGLSASKYFDWKQRYGRVNEHNGTVPRDHWLEAWEQQAIVDFARTYPRDGYRRLTFMMLDPSPLVTSQITAPLWTPGGVLGTERASPDGLESDTLHLS